MDWLDYRFKCPNCNKPLEFRPARLQINQQQQQQSRPNPQIQIQEEQKREEPEVNYAIQHTEHLEAEQSESEEEYNDFYDEIDPDDQIRERRDRLDMEDEDFLNDYNFDEDDEQVILNNGRVVGGIRRENRNAFDEDEVDRRMRLQYEE